MCVRTSTAFYGNFILDMDRSPGFGSAYTDCISIGDVDALFRHGFPSAPHLQCLTSPASAARRTVLQKVRGRTYRVLPQLVNTGFQVLFHSPPGVLFTVPSQYYSLSVIRWYLGLEGGPPIFPRNSTCSAVLWILLAPIPFRLPDSHRLWCAFPCTSASSWNTFCSPKPQRYFYFWFSLLRFRSPLLTESRLISFPRPT